MGDLKTTPFKDAWHSEVFQKLRAANLAEDVHGTVCEKCMAYGESKDDCEAAAKQMRFVPEPV